MPEYKYRIILRIKGDDAPNFGLGKGVLEDAIYTWNIPDDEEVFWDYFSRVRAIAAQKQRLLKEWIDFEVINETSQG